VLISSKWLGIVYLILKFLLLTTHLNIKTHLRNTNEDLFNEVWELSVPPLTDYETTTFKPQKGKDIIKVIYVTFHVCSWDVPRWTKVLQVWKDMRASSLLQNCNFWVNYPFKIFFCVMPIARWGQPETIKICYHNYKKSTSFSPVWILLRFPISHVIKILVHFVLYFLFEKEYHV